MPAGELKIQEWDNRLFSNLIPISRKLDIFPPSTPIRLQSDDFAPWNQRADARPGPIGFSKFM